VRNTKNDIVRVHRNRAPELHPFARAREYTKALVATKMDTMFAKPFIAGLDGHTDGVSCMSTIRNSNMPLISGACDGELRVWDLPTKKCVWSAVGHTGFVRGVVADVRGTTFYTCGDDMSIKQWALSGESTSSSSAASSSSSSSQTFVKPLQTILGKDRFMAIDHHWKDNQLATAGEAVQVWDPSRSTPVNTYKWGVDGTLDVKFNPAEACLLAATCGDRAVCLYDLRASLPMRKFMLGMKSNKVAWNPREPFNFVLANEDHNCYTFDMRKLEEPLMIHKDHVSAVMDVAYSPTGKEFVSGSYDRTVRIFPSMGGRSRDMYHTKRMQRVFSVAYSADSNFIFSGSDDTNVRIWKAHASAALGTQNSREERKRQYTDTLKKKYKHMPEIARIRKDKPTPKNITKAQQMKHIQTSSARRKVDNRVKHSKEGSVITKPERSKVVVKEFT
jgi:WD repeat and SOF domain-containing protein 1